MPLSHGRRQHPTPVNLTPVRSPIHGSGTWKTYIFLGILLYIFFYLMIPGWLNRELCVLQHNEIRPIAGPLLMRHINWVQWLGITLASVCMLLAIHNYIATHPIRNNVHFISRLLAKFTH